MAIDVEVDSGSYTPESMKLRRRLAEAMMKEGIQTTPIASPWQGVARLANALMGGMSLRRLEEREDASAKELRDFTAGTYGVGSGSVGSDSKSPSPQPAASGDKLAFGRKVYDFFKKQGLNDAQAAAIAGNMAWEGGGRADLVNPGDNWRNSPYSPHSAGIAQWNDRLPNLIKYARTQGIEIPEGRLTDANYVRKAIAAIPLETQLGFAWQEMQGPEGRALAMIKAGEDLPTAARGAISYHRPAGWTWNNPAGGHGFQGRMSLAEQIMRAAQQPAPAQVAQAPAGVLNDASAAPPPAPPAAGAVTPPAATVPTGAPGAAGALPTPPVAVGPPPSPAPAPAASPAAAPGLSRQEMIDQAKASLGPRRALVEAALLSNNPKIAMAARAELEAAIARIQAAQPPIDLKKAADLEKTRSDIDENRAQLPKHQADARKATAEARKTEIENEKLLTREEGYARGLSAINQAAGLPERFGKFAFERALGPVVGAEASGAAPPTIHGDPVGYVSNQIAKIGGMLSQKTEGGASDAEVQAAVGGLQAELGQMIRKANGMSAREGDSNVELQNFLKMVGQLPTSTSVEDYNRRLFDVNQRFARLMGQKASDISPMKYEGAQKAEPAVTLQERLARAVAKLMPSKQPLPERYGQPALPQLEEPTEQAMRERLLRAMQGGQ
jgi:hypothetical protein